MVELHLIYVFLYATAAVVSLALAAAAWKRRAARGAVSLAVFMLGVAVWSGALAVRWYLPTFDQQILWQKASGLGTCIVPIAFLTLAFEMAGMRRWLVPGRIALISIASFTLDNLEWLNPGHLYDTAFVPHAIGSYTSYDAVPGPLYWAFIAYAYGLILIGFAIMFRTYLRSSGAARNRAAILLGGALIPFIASVVTEARFVPLGALDLAPLAFLFTGVLWLTAVRGDTLLEVVPMARGALVEQMADGVLVVDAQDHVVDVNPAALAMLHSATKRVLGAPAQTVLSEVRGAAEVLDGGDRSPAVLPIAANGELRYVELTVTPLAVALGEPGAQLVTLHDVTEERRATEGLRLARQVFDTAREGIVVLSHEEGYRIIDVNDAFCRMTGRSSEDVVGRGISLIRSDRHPPGFYGEIEEALLTAGEWAGETWQTRADGTEFPSWLSIVATSDDEGNATHFIAVFTDITDLRETEEKLEYGATHDALTGLPNRLLLDDRLGHAMAHCARAGNRLAVMFFGLHSLKGINDAFGHSGGDILLTEVARRISAVTRESDTVGRYGGDEFAIVTVADVEDRVRIKALAKRLLEAMAMPIRLGAESVHLTASIGVALFPEDAMDPRSLIQRADIAMHGAKESGSGEIRFFSAESQELLERRVALERELWGAEEEDRYSLLYQPQVDLTTGRIVGVEALVRLRARDGSTLSPAEFIPVAEESELILLLGDWVLRSACSDLVALREVIPDLVMSVNFSARQFRETDADSLCDVLRAFGVSVGSLALEVTETAFLSDPQRSAAILADLRAAAGVRLALDDFGTGYSSLTHVRLFRPDTIKIDRSFVAPLPDDPEARAVVLSIIGMAKGLGASVVAEGPETEEQVRFLRANGCDIAQGFYFSRPIPADELILLLLGEPFSLPDVVPSDAAVI